MKELKGLTGLRFVAAFYVFIFHIHLRGLLKLVPDSVQTIVGMGATGVHLFFVLSGFILTYAHLKDFPHSALPSRRYYGRFLLKRVGRIYPLYLIGLLADLGVSIYFRDFPPHFPTILALDITLLQSYFPPLSMEWYGGGAWSVSTEFFFYLVFPLLLPLLLRLPGKTLLPLLLLLAAASSLPSLYAVIHPNTLFFQLTYSFPLSRLPEFVCGSLLGLLVIRQRFRIPEWAVLLLLLATAVYIVKWSSYIPWYTGHNFIVVPAIAALIMLVAKFEQTCFFRWLGSSIMVYLGRISYSFYIIQLSILHVVDGLLAQGTIDTRDAWIILPVLALNLALAALLHKVVERPVHRFVLTTLLKKNLPSALPVG